jgi:hypothetical protein
MAKNAKKISALGFHPDDFQETRIPPVKEATHTDTHTHTDKDTHKDTHTHAHTDTHADTHTVADVYKHADTHTDVSVDTHTPTHVYADTDMSTHTHDDTHKSTHTHTHKSKQPDVYEPVQKKVKTKRIQVLTYESLIQRVDDYASKRGVSRVAVFEAALETYLDKVDPKK